MNYEESGHAPTGCPDLGRRRFVLGVVAGALSAGLWPHGALRASAGVVRGEAELSGRDFRLDVGYLPVNFTGAERLATVVNGRLPAPVLRWREGDRVSIAVTNHLAEDTSIHWHGIILPSAMDGVPHISDGFHGIRPGETFHYAFDLVQSGTYWYHSHSGFQEQTGLYGAIVVEPRAADPVSYDREHVVILSDWSDEDPEHNFYKLKKQGDYFNRMQRTVPDLLDDIRRQGATATWRDRSMWNAMRMTDRDLADVSAMTYTFLMNGETPATGWTGLFRAGERVRLRLINGSAMTIFDVRIPGLKLKVVGADGQNVEPVSVDEIRIGVAETYDVIVEPAADTAYCLFAQSIDRSGFARGTLTPDPALAAPVPPLDPWQPLSHADMGMAMDHASHAPPDARVEPGHHAHHGAARDDSTTDADRHAGHGAAHTPGLPRIGSGAAGFGSAGPVVHAPTEFGPGVDMRAEAPQFRLDDPGVGLRGNGRRVLTYADLRNLTPTPDPREPERELQLHLTGNMHRYMWSFDGIPFEDADPLPMRLGERLRITLVNDTMMNHPIHLHGLWSDLETGDAGHIPRKHTVIVQPGSMLSYLVSADMPGGWAYHCHLMFHMMGMMRKVVVA